MSFIILTRNPRTKQLIAITNGDYTDGRLAEFDTEKAASEAAANTSVCKAWGYDVIEVPKSTD